MASFFGEVVFPSSRAILDTDVEHPLLKAVNNTLTIHPPLEAIHNLIIADGLLAQSFIVACFRSRFSASHRLIFSDASQTLEAGRLEVIPIPKQNGDGGICSSVVVLIPDPQLPMEFTGDLFESISQRFSSSSSVRVLAMVSAPLTSYKTGFRPQDPELWSLQFGDSTPSIVRALPEPIGEGIPVLAPPNFCAGLSASALRLSEVCPKRVNSAALFLFSSDLEVSDASVEQLNAAVKSWLRNASEEVDAGVLFQPVTVAQLRPRDFGNLYS